MNRPHPDDIRERCLRDIALGMTYTEASRVHGVPRGTIAIWVHRARLRGQFYEPDLVYDSEGNHICSTCMEPMSTELAHEEDCAECAQMHEDGSLDLKPEPVIYLRTCSAKGCSRTFITDSRHKRLCGRHS